MESRFRKNKRITTKDFQREVEFLKSAGQMPSLDQVLAAMVEAREEYRDVVIAAREGRTKRKLSAASRAKIAAAQRKRRAKVRKEAGKS